MPTIAEVREKYPQYSDMSDTALADALHQKFYSDLPKADFYQKIGLATQQPEPARPPQGVVENALAPITNYPSTYNQMQRESRELVGEGVSQIGEGGVGNIALGAGKAALGGLGYVASPITAAYRSVIGQPVENITGIPKEYTEFAAQLATPGLGLARLPARVPKSVAPPAPVDDISAAAGRLDIDLPRAVTSDSATVQQAGKIATNVPFAGTPLRAASERAITDLGEAATEARTAFGSGSPASAGTVAREGITDFVKSGPAKKRVDDLYEAVDNIVNPTVTGDMPATRALVGSINARRVNAALPESAATGQLETALSRQGMNYEGIKDLRTFFGEMLDGDTPIPQGMSHGEVKAIYGALSKDMRGIVAKAGGQQGLAAFERANKAAERWAGIRQDLGRLLNIKSEEAIFDKVAAMAGSTARADLNLLGRVRGALGHQKWEEVSSAVIAKMGWPPGGTGFSPDQFLTAYKKLSPAGKRMLFKSTNNIHAQALDDIATVSQRFKELNKFANPSGTGQTVIGTGQLAGVFVDPVTTISAVVGARILSHVLARPATAQAMANWSKAYTAAATAPARQKMTALEASSRVLAATIGREFGRPDLVPDLVRNLMRPIQGPVPAPAQEEQPQP